MCIMLMTGSLVELVAQGPTGGGGSIAGAELQMYLRMPRYSEEPAIYKMPGNVVWHEQDR